MIRRVFQGLFGVLLGALIGIVAVNPSVVGQDKVERRDRKTDKTITVTGKIEEESMTNLKVKVGLKVDTIPSTDVVRIYYDDIPITLKLPYQNLFNNEGKEPLKDLAVYRDLSAKLGAAPDVKAPVKRYIEFRIAMLQTLAAETDEAKGLARRELEQFVAAHPASWEYPFAARALARVLLDKTDYQGALKILDGLARSMTVPPDIKQEAELMLIDVMFQAGKTEEVKAKITAALNDASATEAQKSRFRVYQIGLDAQAQDAKVDEVVKKLDDVISKTPDNTIKALAYNIMGDCYMQKTRKRDAMWAYLWVDCVYSQDKAEHMKAMTKLLSIFDEEKDLEKVQMYKDKIARLR